MSMSYTANMRCMSPLAAFPVPLVGSKPLPSVGSSTVSVPPDRTGSVTVPGAVVVVCSWFCGLGRVVLALERTVLLVDRFDGLVVVVDADGPAPTVVLVACYSSPGATDVVLVSSAIAGSGLVSGWVTVPFFPLLHAPAASTATATTAATRSRRDDVITSPPCRR